MPAGLNRSRLQERSRRVKRPYKSDLPEAWAGKKKPGVSERSWFPYRYYLTSRDSRFKSVSRGKSIGFIPAFSCLLFARTQSQTTSEHQAKQTLAEFNKLFVVNDVTRAHKQLIRPTQHMTMDNLKGKKSKSKAVLITQEVHACPPQFSATIPA